MIATSLLVALVLSATPAPGAELHRVVEGATRFELLSLDPGEGDERDWESSCEGWCYFGWPVLGSTVVDAGTERDVIRTELLRWIDAPEPDGVALCFIPHHGVRVRHDGHVYDFVICYECDQASVYKDFAKEELASLYLSGDPARWDALLDAHRVPRPPEDASE